MTDEPKTKVKNESNDRIYFTVAPRLVWALCENPDEYTFWGVVKDIAGEDGECILSREDLATLSMISAGRVSQVREALIRKRLLKGDYRRDPGYPQKVWHLSIPDIWEANVRWARTYPKLADRVNFKKQQAETAKAIKKEASQDDGSQEASQDDGGVSPNDGGVSPDDAKKNVLKNQKEEHVNTALSIWEKVFTNIERDLKGNARTFVLGVKPVSFENSILTLGACDEMTKSWLQDRLTATVNNLLIGILGDEAGVVWTVAA